MKKTWFDFRLFRDGLRQLRTGALLCGLVLLLQTVLLPVGKLMENGTPQPGVTISAGFFDIFPFSLLLYCAIAPLMAIYLFRFLSQRNASDFFHGIPQTRICLYVSYTAALLVRMLLLQISATAVGVLMHLILPGFQVEIRDVLLSSVQLYACVLFVVGAVMVAVTLTGNMLTNLAVSLLVIFFPRVLMLVVKNCVGESLTIVGDRFLSFLGNGWNLVTGSVFRVFHFGSETIWDSFHSLRAGAYTAGIGILYLVLGCLLFHKRKSEAAGEASVEPGLQLVFRLLPALVFCLLPSARMFGLLTGVDTLTSGGIYNVCVLYLVGIAIYFLYELLSTRKLKNLVRAVPGVLILCALNLLIIFGMLGLRRNLLSFRPGADQIDAVRLVGREVYIWTDDRNGRSLPGYLTGSASEIPLKEKALRELIAARLEETARYDETPADERNVDSNYVIREVAVYTGSKIHYRNVMLLRTDIKMIAEALKSNPDIQKIFMELPDPSDPGVELNMGMIGFYSSTRPSPVIFSEAEKAEVLDALKEDVKDMGFERWYAYCSEPTDSEFTLYMTVKSGNGVKRGSAFPLSKETPKARAKFQEVLWNVQADMRADMVGAVRTLYEKLTHEKDGVVVTYKDSWITLQPNQTEEGEVLYIDLSSPDQLGELLELLEKYQNVPLQPQKGVADLFVSMEYKQTDEEAEKPLYLDTVDAYSMYSGDLLLPLPEKKELETFTSSPTQEEFRG